MDKQEREAVAALLAAVDEASEPVRSLLAEPGFDGLCAMGCGEPAATLCEVHVAAEAREESRRAALEEAARVADEVVFKPDASPGTRMAVALVARRIRLLLTTPPFEHSHEHPEDTYQRVSEEMQERDAARGSGEVLHHDRSWDPMADPPRDPPPDAHPGHAPSCGLREGLACDCGAEPRAVGNRPT